MSRPEPAWGQILNTGIWTAQLLIGMYAAFVQADYAKGAFWICLMLANMRFVELARNKGT